MIGTEKDQAFITKCPQWYREMIKRRYEHEQEDLTEVINNGCDRLNVDQSVREKMLASVANEDRIGISQTINDKRKKLRGM